MGQDDPPERCIRLDCKVTDEMLRASEASIDQRKPVILSNQVTVDGTQLGQLNQILIDYRNLHRGCAVNRPFLLSLFTPVSRLRKEVVQIGGRSVCTAFLLI